MTTVNGKRLCDSHLCSYRSQFLIYFDLGPGGKKTHSCSKHLARAVRDIAATARSAVRAKAIVFVKPLGGTS